MATIIRIKRSTGTSTPTSLQSGELAYSAGTGLYNNGGDRLYYGKGDDGTGTATSRVVIGGEYFANLLDHQPGTLTASSAIITDASSKIDQILVDNIGIGVSDGNTITSTDTNGNIVLSPNGTGTVDVASSRITNVTDPTSAQDAATKAYVDAANDGQTITFQSDSAVTSTVDLNDSSLSILGGEQIKVFSSSSTGVTINLDSSGVTAGTYGSTTEIPVFTVNAQGTLDSAGVVDVATNLIVAADAGSNQTISLLTDTLTLEGSTNIHTVAGGSTDTISIHLDSNVTGLSSLTVDNIKIDGNTISSTDNSNTLYINPWPVGDSGDVVVLGNLTVEGTTTTVNSVTVSLNDKNIVLADSATGAAEADGAGITIGGDQWTGVNKPTILYGASGDDWNFNKRVIAPSLDVDSANLGNLLVDGNTISSVSGNITLDPIDNVIRLSATPFVTSRIPYISDNNGTLATASNFTWANATSTLTVTGRISTDNATIDSAEIGTLTGNNAQFDSDVTVVGLVDTTSLVADSASVLGDIKITGDIIDATTDNLTEGSTNLYFTDERVDDRLNNLLLAGEGIDLVYDDNANSLTVSGEDATVANKGIVSFDSDQFTLTAGYATIHTIDGGTY